jgi:hypothetical protein
MAFPFTAMGMPQKEAFEHSKSMDVIAGELTSFGTLQA